MDDDSIVNDELSLLDSNIRREVTSKCGLQDEWL
jgi:hypothetical protein